MCLASPCLSLLKQKKLVPCAWLKLIYLSAVTWQAFKTAEWVLWAKAWFFWALVCEVFCDENVHLRVEKGRSISARTIKHMPPKVRHVGRLGDNAAMERVRLHVFRSGGGMPFEINYR
jgi:hypothetical protein